MILWPGGKILQHVQCHYAGLIVPVRLCCLLLQKLGCIEALASKLVAAQIRILANFSYELCLFSAGQHRDSVFPWLSEMQLILRTLRTQMLEEWLAEVLGGL